MLVASKRGAEAVVERRGIMGDYLLLVNKLSRTILNKKEDNLSRDQDFSGIFYRLQILGRSTPYRNWICLNPCDPHRESGSGGPEIWRRAELELSRDAS